MAKKYFLPEYTLKILASNKWTQSELAARSKLSRTAINDVINRKAKGGYKYAIAIAEAANRPIEEALQAAGIMDITNEPDNLSKEILHNVHLMDEINKIDTLEYIKMRIKLQRQKRNNKNDQKGNRPPSP